ncbi:MAG: BMP family ABC transporter substrate-binding protein [Lachnospiraceae bacterium]|nr:BMP family ABC transporter substrate-binding protein [Lachnospiraceae bacterium]
MKKITYLTLAVFILVLIGIFGIHTKDEFTDVTAEKTKVGCVLIGSVSDDSWTESHYDALEKVAETLNLEMVYCENVVDDSSCMNVMEELIANGCEIIICNSYGYGPYVIKVAEKYPSIMFLHASGTEIRENLGTYFGRAYQMRYLSGIVAGMQTETNEIGYVAAFDNSEVNRGINAFTLGVQTVNPDAKVYVAFSDSWTDYEQNEQATERLLEHHDIDVITLHADSNATLDIAEAKGIWSIGYNVDNAENYPNTFLTASVWSWEKYYEPYLKKSVQKKNIAVHYWEGVETGVVSLAPFTEHVEKETVAYVNKEYRRIQQEYYDVFYGPIYDTTGRLRVNKGEKMSDEALRYQFDWYVNGVILDE